MCGEIITDAEGMRAIYRDRYGRDSTVIAYSAELVQSRDRSILTRYGLEPREYYLVAARLVPSNQIRTIVEAFQGAGAGRVLAIAGAEDPVSAYYQALRAAAGPKVRFLGLISDQAHMDELYANAYAYLHGATLGGINSALLRPLGAGCPAIAADTPFNREVLERDDGGRCGSTWRDDTELRDAIGVFEGDLRVVESLREPCRRQIRENFSWDLVTDQYEVFYRGFVERWPAERIRAEVAAQKVKYATRT